MFTKKVFSGTHKTKLNMKEGASDLLEQLYGIHTDSKSGCIWSLEHLK